MYFTIFDIIEPSYYGHNKTLYKTNILSKVLGKEFLFRQTGECSGYNYGLNTSSKFIVFFTFPPKALFECAIKAVFPDLFILLIFQFPFLFFKRAIINWSNK